MDIKLDGNRCRTTSPYDVRVTRALLKLEGMKRWGVNRSLSFENTPYNLEVWRSTFPEARIEGREALESPTEAAQAIFDVPSTRPCFQFRTPPRAHQKRALEKLSSLTACGLFMDIGTGKSWTGIAMIGQRWCAGRSDHVLLIAKNGVHEQWVEEQIPQHMSPSVPYKCWIFDPHRKAGRRAFEQLLQFDGLKIFAINIDAINTKAGEKFILEFLAAARGRATIIVDESQDIKNWNAGRTKAAIKYAKLCAFRMIMTGTPIARDLLDLFSQFQFLDESIIGHRYITTYKSHYCVYEDTDFGPKLVGHKNVEQLYKRIDPYIFRITSEEALDLPPKVYDPRKFVLTSQQLKMMQQLKDNFFASLPSGSQLNVKNAAALIIKLQQIACGWLADDDGNIERFENPRIDAMKDIIDQRSGKVIIWCRFHEDIDNVMKALGSGARHYYGLTEQSDRAEAKRLFIDKTSSVRWLVASAETAGTGLDGLQHACSTNIYYSQSYNALARWQSEGRTWRDGTTETVTYFDLIAKGSPDLGILRNIRKKKEISDLTLDDFRRLLDMEGADEAFAT